MVFDGVEFVVDVVFCSYYGFEGVILVCGFLDGEIFYQIFGICFWKVDCDVIFDDDVSCIEWFFDEWECVECWVIDSVVF